MEPLYWSKHYHRLLFAVDEVLAETLDSYQRIYLYSDPKLEIIQKLLMRIDKTKLRSKFYLRRWAVQQPNVHKFNWLC